MNQWSSLRTILCVMASWVLVLTTFVWGWQSARGTDRWYMPLLMMASYMVVLLIVTYKKDD